MNCLEHSICISLNNTQKSTTPLQKILCMHAPARWSVHTFDFAEKFILWIGAGFNKAYQSSIVPKHILIFPPALSCLIDIILTCPPKKQGLGIVFSSISVAENALYSCVRHMWCAYFWFHGKSRHMIQIVICRKLLTTVLTPLFTNSSDSNTNSESIAETPLHARAHTIC